jgi:hypothetical protein
MHSEAVQAGVVFIAMVALYSQLYITEDTRVSDLKKKGYMCIRPNTGKTNNKDNMNMFQII